MKYTVIIPAHNEADRLVTGAARLAPVLRSMGSDQVEIIVIDDGSHDGTGPRAVQAYAEFPHVLVVRQENNRGKGAAIRLGFALATGDMVFTCDADMSIDPRHLPEMAAALGDVDIAVGSRDTDGHIVYDSWLRTWSGRLFNAFVRWRIGTTVRDTQCGCKAFRLPVARALGLLGLLDGFAYDVEMLMLAQGLGFSVTSVPVTWDDVAGSSVHVVRDGFAMLADITQLPSHSYEVPSITLPAGTTQSDITDCGVAAHIVGLVVAANSSSERVLLPRDAVVAAIAMSTTLRGKLGVVRLSELVGARWSVA